MISEAWHSRSADEALTYFGSSATGLSATDASARLAANGPNELTEGTRIGPLKILLGQFKSLLLWILIAAGVISGALGDAVDAIVILAIVVLKRPHRHPPVIWCDLEPVRLIVKSGSSSDRQPRQRRDHRLLASTRMTRRIFLMRRRGEQRCPCGIGCCGGISVSGRLWNRRDRPPKHVGVLRIPTADRRICDGQVQESEEPGILQRRVVPRRTRVIVNISVLTVGIPAIVFGRSIDQRDREIVPNVSGGARVPRGKKKRGNVLGLVPIAVRAALPGFVDSRVKGGAPAGTSARGVQSGS